MKKSIITLMLFLFLTASSLTAASQESETSPKTTPKWISDKGYWVIEDNINAPKTCMVRFYNNGHTLIYSEKIEGVTLNVRRIRTCMRLKKALDQALRAWEKKQEGMNVALVKQIFRVKE